MWNAKRLIASLAGWDAKAKCTEGDCLEKGESLHLDGVQSQVKDGTLLWSEIPCFLSYHVVLEPQKKQYQESPRK